MDFGTGKTPTEVIREGVFSETYSRKIAKTCAKQIYRLI